MPKQPQWKTVSIHPLTGQLDTRSRPATIAYAVFLVAVAAVTLAGLRSCDAGAAPSNYPPEPVVKLRAKPATTTKGAGAAALIAKAAPKLVVTPGVQPHGLLSWSMPVGATQQVVFKSYDLRTWFPIATNAGGQLHDNFDGARGYYRVQWAMR